MGKITSVMLTVILAIILCLTMTFGITAYADDEIGEVEVLAERVDNTGADTPGSPQTDKASQPEEQQESTPLSETPQNGEQNNEQTFGQTAAQDDAQSGSETPEQTVDAEPTQEPVEDTAKEPVEKQESENTPADSALSYVITVTDTDGNSVDVTGGTEIAVADILKGLGYEITGDTLIEVDPSGVDTDVIAVSDTASGPVLTDKGPLGRAEKNMIVYVNGVAIELELVDPTELKAGNNTAQEFMDAFGTDDLNVILDEDITMTGNDSGNVVKLYERIQLTVSGTQVSGKEYDGTTTASAETGDVSGIISGDDVKVIIAGASFSDKNAGIDKNVLVSYALTGSKADKYIAPESETLTADITAKQLSVSGTTVKSKTYDGTNNAGIDSVGTLGGVLPDDKVKLNAAASFSDPLPGDGKEVSVVYTLFGADAANYIAPEDTTLTADIFEAPAAADMYCGDRIIAITDDKTLTVEVKTAGDRAVIAVYDAGGNRVTPENISIIAPEVLSAKGVRTAEIVLTDGRSFVFDLDALMGDANTCVIRIEFADGIVSVYRNELVIFTADLSDIMDNVSKLVYDGAALRALDANGNVLREFAV